jgi:NitT/TauT family transport system substrate-binding protein
MRLKGLALGSAAALAIAGGAAFANETVNVGICVSWPGYAMLKVASEKGLIPGYDLNITIFEDPLGGHAAMAAGQLDVYGCTAD